MYNFARFVEWPPELFADNQTPFSIAVLGNDRLGAILDSTLQGKTVNNRRITILHLKWPTDLKPYHIVFIGSSEPHLPQIMESLQGVPVLTVTEAEVITHSKSVINLIVDDKKVRFEIDIDKAEHSGLKISSKLLMLARVFRNGKLDAVR